MQYLNYHQTPTEDQKWEIITNGYGRAYAALDCVCGWDDLESIVEDGETVKCPKCGAKYQLTTITTHYLAKAIWESTHASTWEGLQRFPNNRFAIQQALRQADAVIVVLANATDGEVDAAIKRYGNMAWHQGFASGSKAEISEIEGRAEDRQAAGTMLRALVAARTLVPATPEGGSHDQ